MQIGKVETLLAFHLGGGFDDPAYAVGRAVVAGAHG